MKCRVKFEKLTVDDAPYVLQFDGVEEKKETLRQMREDQCYTYVNRGDAWYKRLSEEQNAEFDVWYQEWLDVTKTFKVPNKPKWLK